ncbi:SurA N-terminal domain-containing protein [Thalassospira xianhensis]|uniref:Parvulin-like PPIase n=1 Tax=Thalassospira xianhensis MCCC 1A02616 TaxID=1177929 RepID=A0A367UHZ6_9PROT|nr:SurA N-terminal domain-containing protein [Thalassospira xianhensis]RCK06934.1 peptidylprolyl isomerase [Thalassospira xianhensis MCCC 1A02616]
MLAGIRSFSKSIFAKIILGVIAISFVGWGLNASMLNLGTSRQVAEIGSQNISPAELDRAFQRSIQNMRSVFGPNFDRQQAIQMGLLNNTVQNLVSQKILRENAKEMGIGISNEKVRDTIFASPGFQNETTGQFDRERFLQALYSSGYTEPEFIEGVRGDMMGQQVVGSLAGAVNAPDVMAQQIAAYRNEQRGGSFFALNPSEFDNIETPDDATLRKYHEDNAPQFTAPESRTVTLVTLSATDLAANMDVTEDEINEAYNHRLPEFQTPEKRVVEQILFAPNEKESAQEAYKALQNGADFMTVATEDAGMDPSIVKLGEFTADNILPDLRDATFGLEEGAFSEPVETALGWHIIRVTAITPERTETLDQVRNEVEEGVKQFKAEDAIYDLAARLDDELGAGTPLEEAANAVGAKTYKLNDVVRGEGLDVGIADSAEINAMIFELDKGEDSFLEETSTGVRYVARVDEVTPAALRPFEEVRDDVVAAWKADERNRLMLEKADQLAASINDQNADIASLATSENAEVTESGLTKRTGQGLADGVSPAVAAALFTLDEGKAKAIQSGENVLVLKLDEIKAATIAEGDADPVVTELKQALNEDILAQYLDYLQDEISVSVNNSVINGLYPQTAAN